jgi:hypothetical protein
MKWCEAAATLLATAMKSDPLAGVEALKRMVQKRQATLLSVSCNDYMVGAVVLRVDRKPLGDEGVIVAAAGKLKGVSLIELLLPHIEKKFRGVKAIRIHTARPGLVRAMMRHGYRSREYVLAKEV